MKKVFFAFALLLFVSSCGLKQYTSDHFKFSQSINPETKNHVFVVKGDSLYETSEVKKYAPVAEFHYFISDAQTELKVETADANFDWEKFFLDMYSRVKKAIKK